MALDIPNCPAHSLGCSTWNLRRRSLSAPPERAGPTAGIPRRTKEATQAEAAQQMDLILFNQIQSHKHNKWKHWMNRQMNPRIISYHHSKLAWPTLMDSIALRIPTNVPKYGTLCLRFRSSCILLWARIRERCETLWENVRSRVSLTLPTWKHFTGNSSCSMAMRRAVECQPPPNSCRSNSA